MKIRCTPPGPVPPPPLRERPVNACIECRLRIFDGNGFSESDLVGRPSDPKPETILRNLENICRERSVLSIRISLDCCPYDCMPCVCFWPAAMADVFDLPPSAAGQLWLGSRQRLTVQQCGLEITCGRPAQRTVWLEWSISLM